MGADSNTDFLNDHPFDGPGPYCSFCGTPKENARHHRRALPSSLDLAADYTFTLTGSQIRRLAGALQGQIDSRGEHDGDQIILNRLGAAELVNPLRTHVVVIVGNPLDGFGLVGPFSTSEEAVRYVDQTGFDYWWIADLDKPE